jgi:small subunit ribosomal protein S20
MPHLDSAKKSLRQSAARNAQNRAVIKDLKTQIKKLLKSIKAGAKDALTADYQLACSKLDKSAARGYIHKNAAARTKGRLAARIAKASAAPASKT